MFKGSDVQKSSMPGHHFSNKKGKIPREATFKTGKKKIPDHYTAKGPQRAGKTK